MKYLSALILVLALIIVGNLTAKTGQKTCLNVDEIATEKITAKSITITSGDGKHRLTLHAWETGVGLFTSGQNGEVICLVDQDSMSPYIGLNTVEHSAGCPIALTLDNGLPAIQVVGNKAIEHDGEQIVSREVRWINANQLLGLSDVSFGQKARK